MGILSVADEDVVLAAHVHYTWVTLTNPLQSGIGRPEYEVNGVQPSPC